MFSRFIRRGRPFPTVPPFARGFSAFGVPRSSYVSFLRSCRRIGLSCEAVTASGFRRAPTFTIRPDRPVALWQDLPADSPLLADIVHRVVFPAWFARVPVCFFSPALRREYPGPNPGSDSLHVDFHRIESFLHREQLVRLLELSDAVNLPPAGPVRSPPRESVVRSVPDDVLDPSQAAAARHGRGPMRVLAPAGSGKTKTLVGRICNLVNGGVDPGCILPLAFNTKAAGEMNERLSVRNLGDIRARTFHSLGYEIVRAGSRLVFEAENEEESTRRLLNASLFALHPARGPAEGETLERLVRMLSAVKMDILPLDGLSAGVNGVSIPFGPLFCRYLALQEECGLMNFDDMIYRALRVLIDNDQIRMRYQNRFTYLLVDEFQDLNRAQMLLLRILAYPENNLFVVGDDDQLIYGWRGAEIRSIIDFPRTYPCACATVLSTNYRSSSAVVAHAGWLIGRNRERVPKSVAVREGAPRGSFDTCLRAGLWEQAESAAEWIAGKPASAPWCETAVLFRYNVLGFVAGLALERRGIPHAPYDDRRLFESRAGKDVTAWLTVLFTPGEAGGEVLERLLRRPGRILRRDLAREIRSWQDLENLPGSGRLTGEEEILLEAFIAGVERLRARSPDLTACEVVGEIDEMLHLHAWYARRRPASPDPEDADDGTYLDVLSALSRNFASGPDFLAHITALRNAPAPECAAGQPPERDEVVLSTIHRAKGNEFRRVVLFDLSRRHRHAKENVEEERRVAYVALTRAKDALLITANGRRQSPFLREAALDPRFARRMREDLESELRGLRSRLRRLPAASSGAALRRKDGLCEVIGQIEEELRCRAALGFPRGAS